MTKVKQKVEELKENAKEDFEKEKEKVEGQRKNIMRKLEILGKYSERKPENSSEFRELSSVLCFGSPSWCCAIKKNPYGSWKSCMWRDLYLQVLGIDKEEFMEIKDKVDEGIREKLGNSFFD